MNGTTDSGREFSEYLRNADIGHGFMRLAVSAFRRNERNGGVPSHVNHQRLRVKLTASFGTDATASQVLHVRLKIVVSESIFESQFPSDPRARINRSDRPRIERDRE